jgi:3-deoxy-manno-octulosonate cytidylyltransferase (CMP-KDO synthetase)
MKNAVIIPARLNSKRFPGKIIYKINGLPMVEHVRRRALLSKSIDKVFIATGDQDIANELQKYNANIIFTEGKHENGTSRISEAAKYVNCENVILVQGDEPLILPDDIDRISNSLDDIKSFNCVNATCRLDSKDELFDHNIVKCSVIENKIIYCYRTSPSTSPFSVQKKYVHKLLGLMAFKKKFLLMFDKNKNSIIQKTESIEQMKLIEQGFSINNFEINENQPSINTFEDLIEYQNFIKKTPKQDYLLNKTLQMK